MLFQSLKKQFPAIKENEPLKNHSTFRVGGPADFFYELHNIEELPALIEFAETNQMPYFIFGQGSNILFLDGGVRGLVIKNFANRIAIDGNEITADSGALLGTIIIKSLEYNLTGLEPLFGLPGTIGGAVYGNAGVPHCEISDFLKYVTVYNVADGIHTLNKESILFNYRNSSFKKPEPRTARMIKASGSLRPIRVVDPEGEREAERGSVPQCGTSPSEAELQMIKDVILTVTLVLKPGNAVQSRAAMKEFDAVRRGKQPKGFTCGSFFKNPSAGKPAGMLIDKARLKGIKINGAQISEKHGNFFINLGNATAKDILLLRDLAKRTVKEKFGIELEEEVRIVGEY